MWSAACSTGEEVYSLALLLWHLKKQDVLFDFNILGTDIDARAIEAARKGCYINQHLRTIPAVYQSYLVNSHAKRNSQFRPLDEIMNRCHFKTFNLLSDSWQLDMDSIVTKFDIIFCRNVLSNFDIEEQKNVLNHLKCFLRKKGILALGAREKLAEVEDFRTFGESLFLKSGIEKEPSLSLKKKEYPAFGKLSENAFVFGESELNEKDDIVPPILLEKTGNLLFKSLNLSRTTESLQKNEKNNYCDFRTTFEINKINPEVIVIGASTGGPSALAAVLKDMPRNSPPVVVIQHLDVGHSNYFAESLSQKSTLKDGFGEISDQEPDSNLTLLKRGCIYIAKGDYHLSIVKTSAGLAIQKTNGEKKYGSRPSINVLFDSLSFLDVESVAVILTGMGQDGAVGMLNLVKTEKCYTMAQDENSCAVFGMPKKAIELGATRFVGDLKQIRNKIFKLIENK